MQHLTMCLLVSLAHGLRHRRERFAPPTTQYQDEMDELRQQHPELNPSGGGGSGLTPGDFKQCHLSESDCNIKDMTEATLVYTDSDISKCWNGEPFAFLVHPGRTDQLFYYFPGGGICFEFPVRLPGATRLCLPDMEGGITNIGYGDGVTDYSVAGNVFKDYTFVSAPYCTGGAHVANTTVKTLLGTYFQYDYNNNEFARSWAMQNMDANLKSLVIMGSSAGALGAVSWSSYLLSTFRYDKATVLFDSYMGILPGNTLSRLLQNFKSCGLKIFEEFRDACEKGEFSIADVLEQTIAKYPKVVFAHMEAKTDLIQRVFYTAVGLTFLNLDIYISGDRFYRETNTMMQRFNKYPNYLAYFVQSTWHTFTQWPLWYKTTVAGEDTDDTAGKPSLYEWTAQVVDRNGPESQCLGELKANGARGTSYCDEQLFPKALAV